MRRLARAAVVAARRQSCRFHDRMYTERRLGRRMLVTPSTLRLTPVLEDGATPEGESFRVIGRYVSEGGLDFYSHGPLASRYVRLVLPGSQPDQQVVLVTHLRWCRFSSDGIHENGGVFVHQEVRPKSGAD